jgi:hypothetical protein
MRIALVVLPYCWTDVATVIKLSTRGTVGSDHWFMRFPDTKLPSAWLWLNASKSESMMEYDVRQPLMENLIPFHNEFPNSAQCRSRELTITKQRLGQIFHRTPKWNEGSYVWEWACLAIYWDPSSFLGFFTTNPLTSYSLLGVYHLTLTIILLKNIILLYQLYYTCFITLKY